MTLFGRLDITYPDGKREQHQLRGSRITVGSASACTVQLANKSVADIHFRLEAGDGGVTITDLDSAAGTVVDGQRIPANRPRPLADTTRIAIGALQLTFYKHSDSPTISIPALSEMTQPASAGFRAHLENDQATVFPASNITVPLSITNTSDRDAEFRVEASGLPDNWIKPKNLAFPLPAREATQLQFLIKPDRRSDIPPQTFPLHIQITRLDETQQVLRLVGTIELGGFGGLSLAVDPPVCKDKGSFQLYLFNQGNEALSLVLECSDPDSKLDIQLSQTALTLPPGGRSQVAGTVRWRRRPLLGDKREQPFILLAKAKNPTGYRVPLPASVSVTPVASRRLAASLAAIFFALIVAAALIIFQPPAPVITDMSLSGSQVAQGTPVQISWSAEHAQRYVIEVDRVPIAELPGDASAYTLDTREYSDPVGIALIAQGGETTVIRSRSLDIYKPVAVNRFYTDRTSMLRNVIGGLTVRWAVEGAVSLDVAGPLDFDIVGESRASDSSGELMLRGAPLADFEILLSARDEIGNITRRAIQIAIRDPECSPHSDTLLYAGPDARYAPVSIAVENVPVLVHGTNDSRDWLQVELASGQIGWGNYSRFFCQGFAPAALALITDVPALPTATATPAPTATPSPTPSPTSAVAFTPFPTPNPTVVEP
ncbi:MAG: FHA domain-containing protein [Chloroflexi bacterium]|nr:FHA domain-containing protein [Chloroflexota bacterium]